MATGTAPPSARSQSKRKIAKRQERPNDPPDEQTKELPNEPTIESGREREMGDFYACIVIKCLLVCLSACLRSVPPLILAGRTDRRTDGWMDGPTKPLARTEVISHVLVYRRLLWLTGETRLDPTPHHSLFTRRGKSIGADS